MLNYVWMALIVVGLLVAAGNDIRDEVRNTYRNGMALEATILVAGIPSAGMAAWEGELVISSGEFNAFYGSDQVTAGVRQEVKVKTAPDGRSIVSIPVNEETPDVWRTMAKTGTTGDVLTASLRSIRFSDEGRHAMVRLEFEPVRFVKLKAVTQAAFDSASTAVTIAIGLIGIMALWLGVMKVAQEAGVVQALTRVLAPATKKLFPEIPPDHPAVGAMIMNISANMLGLSNAATPFGLKAMEELNKLNPKAGTATNAMCTFLAINTAGLVLIPATAIAVRAAAGSANPGIIIGTSLFGASCATLAGLVAVKLLQRLRVFRKDDPALLNEGGPGRE